MKNQLILAAAAVPDLKVADVDYNTDQIVRLIKENSECGLIVFPESAEVKQSKISRTQSS